VPQGGVASGCSAFPSVLWNKRCFRASGLEGRPNERSSHINRIRRRFHAISTRFSPLLRKAEALRAPLLVLAAICLVTLPACSTLKAAVKPKQAKQKQETPAPENGLIGQDQEAVKKKLGQPSDVSKTAEGDLLWVYRPPWKFLPDDKGTQYVEFRDGKVIKVFKKE